MAEGAAGGGRVAVFFRRCGRAVLAIILSMGVVLVCWMVGALVMGWAGLLGSDQGDGTLGVLVMLVVMLVPVAMVPMMVWRFLGRWMAGFPGAGVDDAGSGATGEAAGPVRRGGAGLVVEVGPVQLERQVAARE